MRKKLAAAAFIAAVAVSGVPAPAIADHDCGPPPHHSHHKFDQDDRKNPCKK